MSLCEHCIRRPGFPNAGRVLCGPCSWAEIDAEAAARPAGLVMVHPAYHYATVRFRAVHLRRK